MIVVNTPPDRPPDRITEDGLRWWVEPADDATDARAAALGLVRTRTLHQLAIVLEDPTEDPLPTRAFRRGSDEAGWLRTNNAAFAGHPDQGGWTYEDLDRALARPWVRLDDILIHTDPEADPSGVIDGFCWTRLHPEGAPPSGGGPPVGEIFVIAAHPSRHGTGLGSRLVRSGLDHLAVLGVAEAILYVEADNTAALSTYANLGFRHRHDRVAYETPEHP